MQISENAVHFGNESYLGALFEHIQNSGNFRLAFIGGSITQGCHASCEQNRYANRLTDGLGKLFTSCGITMLNAGIGATDSLFACARVRDQVLSSEPDAVIVDFTVNDTESELYKDSFESLVRILLSHSSVKAVIVLENAFFDSRKSALKIHRLIAEHYGLAQADTAQMFAPLTESSAYTADDLSTDLLHPTDLGHELIARLLLRLFEMGHERFKASSDRKISKPQMPQMLTQCSFIRSRTIDSKSSEPVAEGFIADADTDDELSNAFQGGWLSHSQGDRITLSFRAKKLYIRWRRTVSRPAPCAIAVIDGEQDKAIRLDAAFEETWGDLSCMTLIGEFDGTSEHTLTVTTEKASDEVPFMLISFILFS